MPWISPACIGQDRSATAADPLTTPGSLQARIPISTSTSADGLSQDNVFAILQDHKSFMWFATQGGLNRYDGAVVTQYRHDPRNANSPSGDFITDVLEDKQGYIWFSSPGLDKFDPATGKFTRYRPANLLKQRPTPSTSANFTRTGTAFSGLQGTVASYIDLTQSASRSLSLTSASICQAQPNSSQPQFSRTKARSSGSEAGADLSGLTQLQEMSVFISAQIPKIRSLKLCMGLLLMPVGHSLSLTTTA